MSDVEKVARAIPDEAVEAAVEACLETGRRLAWGTTSFRQNQMTVMRAAIEAALPAMGEREAVRLSWSEKGFDILSSLPPDVRGLVRPSQREDEVYLAASEGVDERLIISISEDGIAYCYQVDGRFCPGKEDWQDPRKIPDDVIDHLRRLSASPRPEEVEEAVKAERERCARVVDAIADEYCAAYERNRAAGYTHDNDLRALQTAWCIATAIRATEESKG